MILDPTPEKIKCWSLDGVKYLLGHLEDFIDNDVRVIQNRARTFTPTTGLEDVLKLVDGEPGDVRMPGRVFEGLSQHYDCGLMLQRDRATDAEDWLVTDIFWRGSLFHLEAKDLIPASKIIPKITPLQVHRAQASKILNAIHLQFLAGDNDAAAYLLKPMPALAYVLISDLAHVWSADHLAETHRLVNKCFIY